MAESLTKPLTPQTQALINEFEFRVNREPETRPTMECRRRGTLHWTVIAFIPPDSNYYIIMCDTLIETATAATEVVEEPQS